MISKYLVIFGIGHLLGDFYFQSESLAACKDKKYTGVLWHSLEYYAVMTLAALPIFSQDIFGAVTCVAFVHWIIDTVKYVLLKKKKIRKDVKVFAVDQGAHVVSIFAAAYLMEQLHFTAGRIEILYDVLNAFGLEAENLARWIFAILLIHKPVNIFIQSFLGDYKPKNNMESIIQADHKAGRRIGTVERLVMLIFLSMNQYTAMGFVLTAKSIARYDKIAKDEKFAEYYLLGTLVSTLCVIVCGKLILI